jgi:hypothetical protein|tara:strand:+ start:41 stop:496 length:456 start_codon:yes stop_codon:yes gene_type:complete
MADISIKGHSPILRHGYKKGGSVYHTTKEGKKARKGLWYNIHQKRKRGEKMRAKGAKGAPTEKAIKRSQLKEGGSAAWTRKEGKSPSGGLNQKGRDSYKGGTLKAPTKSKTSSRRKSFCARMGGMKKKLTSAKTARDPNSRINKSLRKWDC